LYNKSHNNIAIGYSALSCNRTGCDNIAIGCRALFANGQGNRNIAIGIKTLASVSFGNENIAIGNYSSLFTTAANNNVAIGSCTLNQNCIGSNIVAIGRGALNFNLNANNNTAIGTYSLQFNTTGANNVAIGYRASSNNVIGYKNTSVGAKALCNNTGCNNIGFGYGALKCNTTGFSNIGIGINAGEALTFGSNNTLIGSSTVVSGLSSTVIIAAGTTERIRANSSGLFINGAPLTATFSATDTTVNATFYPIFVSGTSGTPSIRTTATAFTFNPSTGDLTVPGNVSSFSDRRLKTNIKNLENSLEKVLSMQGVSFTDTSDRPSIGLIAQDVLNILPEVVLKTEEYYTISYANIVAILIEAIKELKKEIDEMKK